MSDPVTTGLGLPAAEAADLVEQGQDAAADDVPEPDLTDPAVESDPADVLEQRREIGYDDGHDEAGTAP